MTSRRWPDAVYGEGEEPDYRFSLANERTFLAWTRTALAFLAAGVALDVVDLSLPTGLQRGAAVALVVLGLLGAVVAWTRWALTERAMRRGTPLPSFGAVVLLSAAVVLVGIVLVVGAIRGG